MSILWLFQKNHLESKFFMSTKNTFQLLIRVKNEIGVLTRIVTLLRKYRINIRSLHISPLDNKEVYSDMLMEIISKREDIDSIINKLYNLIPVLEVRQGKNAHIKT
ncbi:MAG: hypothetical protein S4CHLAM7_10150 [Chlamydiae bacterium]|nr:hypothetical protein [Chlamydiota bacterium]